MEQSIMRRTEAGVIALVLFLAFIAAIIPLCQAHAQEATGASQDLGAGIVSIEGVSPDKPGDEPGASANGEPGFQAATQHATLGSASKKTMKGIDISSWQAGINVKKVKADFVIVKATGGTEYTNPYFREWADAARASGKLLGLYHYAREASSPGTAGEEARHFVKEIKPYIGKAVLVLDFEGSALDMKNCVSWAKKFMKMVYKKTQVKPLIYLSQNATHIRNWSSVARTFKLWVAQYLYRNFNTGYLKNPKGGNDLAYWSSAKMYQYSSTGKVKGYDGDLDLNIFYGGKAAWKKLARKS